MTKPYVIDGKRYIEVDGNEVEIANVVFCPYCGSEVIYHDIKRVSCSLADCPLSKHRYSWLEFTSKKFVEAIEYFRRNEDYLRRCGIM